MKKLFKCFIYSKRKARKVLLLLKEDIELIKQRLKWAEVIHKEKYGKKNTKKD